MEVRYLIMARYAEFTPDSRLNLIGGDTDKIFLDEYPAVYPSLHAAAKILMDKEDTKKEHTFKSLIRDADGEIIAEGASGKIGTLGRADNQTRSTMIEANCQNAR